MFDEIVVVATLFSLWVIVLWLRNRKVYDLREKVDGVPFIAVFKDGTYIVINLKDRKIDQDENH